MKKAVIYIHGKGGSANEAEHYIPLFQDFDVIGYDYKAATPWDAVSEFSIFFDTITDKYENITLIANSIGAYFSMHSLSNKHIADAFFISPIVDMEKLIIDMLKWSGSTENELHDKKEIPTPFDETLSWDYLDYVRANPIEWNIPTKILYGENDDLTSYRTISEFAEKTGAKLTIMKNGEHWFHTDEQMAFLDSWIKSNMP